VSAPWDLNADSVPDVLASAGVPESRGASSGVTMSTTIASGVIDCNEFAPTRNSPSTRAPTWPMTEITIPGRMNRFNPIILVGQHHPACRHPTGNPNDCLFYGRLALLRLMSSRELESQRLSRACSRPCSRVRAPMPWSHGMGSHFKEPKLSSLFS
jgi:hypothetical protein